MPTRRVIGCHSPAQRGREPGHQRPWSSRNGDLILSTLNGRVDFTKVEATYSRMQPLFERLSLLVAAHGQYAANPLLSPELCGYAAARSARAFDPSALVADECINVLGELRLDLPHSVKQLTQMQLYAFADRGWAAQSCSSRWNARERRCGVGRRRHSFRLAAAVRALWRLLDRSVGRQGDRRATR